MRFKKHTIYFSVLFFLPIFVACSKEEPMKIKAVADRTKIARMQANEITTLISDSGITRYRISTPRWDFYDQAKQPYQEFPEGIHFERFDKNLKVDANIHSKYARFWENEQRWELRGNVKMTNIQGQLFETELLFWDQRSERFFSDSLITITEPTRIIKGIGFESNQTLTNYTIRKIKGVFPFIEK